MDINSERYSLVGFFDNNIWIRSCPVEVLQGALIMDSLIGQNCLQMSLVNHTDKRILSVYVDIFLRDASGDPLLDGQSVGVVYRDMNMDKGVPFGDEVTIYLRSGRVRSVECIVSRVLYMDGNVWHAAEKPVRIKAEPYYTLREDLRTLFEEEVKNSKYADSGYEFKYVPSNKSSYWVCTCGRANDAGAESCQRCGMECDWLLGTLNVSYLERLARERREQQMAEEQRREEERLAAEQQRLRRREEESRRMKELEAAPSAPAPVAAPQEQRRRSLWGKLRRQDEPAGQEQPQPVPQQPAAVPNTAVPNAAVPNAAASNDPFAISEEQDDARRREWAEAIRAAQAQNSAAEPKTELRSQPQPEAEKPDLDKPEAEKPAAAAEAAVDVEALREQVRRELRREMREQVAEELRRELMAAEAAAKAEQPQTNAVQDKAAVQEQPAAVAEDAEAPEAPKEPVKAAEQPVQASAAPEEQPAKAAEAVQASAAPEEKPAAQEALADTGRRMPVAAQMAEQPATLPEAEEKTKKHDLSALAHRAAKPMAEAPAPAAKAAPAPEPETVAVAAEPETVAAAPKQPEGEPAEDEEEGGKLGFFTYVLLAVLGLALTGVIVMIYLLLS